MKLAIVISAAMAAMARIQPLFEGIVASLSITSETMPSYFSATEK